MKKTKIHPSIIYTFTIFYLEILTKVIMTKHLLNTGLIYMIVFTIPIIILITILTKSFNEKINKIISIIIMLIITIFYGAQFVYFILFSVPFSFSSISMADQALDFVNIIKDTLIKYWYYILAIILPYILLIVFNKHIDYKKYNKYNIISLITMFIISYLSTFAFLIPNEDNSKKLYFNIDNSVAIIDKFGMLTYTKIDIKRQLFGFDSELINSNTTFPIINETNEPEEIVYGDNALDIDFSSLESKNKNIQKLNSYMNSELPTNKNQYTGMFKGKNLIFILAEGFNEVAVDETRTPTLYKMINNGFVFNNFYSPVHLSTTGGEFQATTGLVPTQGTLSAWKKQTPTISYGIGNAFSNIGYNVQSYHNWTYTYYKRNITMKTLGFNSYTGCGNGLEKKINCQWLPSDVDMINVTLPDYINKEGNFATYYVTVSGHSPYNASSNIAKKYLNQIEGEYSSAVKYYLASQMELDSMLETLINKLAEANQLENTVIALVGDHYPYTLSTDEMNEMSSYKKDSTIEVNHSNFIIWNSEIKEPIIIDKLGSQIDVLPTLLNLFGIEYDSRLIVGKDILSDTGCVAIFSNYSWVSDYGTYNANTNKFTLKEGKELENINEYVKEMKNRVSNAYSISKMIIENDYYTYVLGSE
ncbi:MAG: LTA synthase family protein [Candidatus Coprovivens sp.]